MMPTKTSPMVGPTIVVKTLALRATVLLADTLVPWRVFFFVVWEDCFRDP